MAEKNSSEIDRIKSTNRILILALIIAAFFLGALTNKVATLEKNGTLTIQPAASAPQQAAPAAITNDNIKKWAKEIGLNSNNFNSCFDSDKYKDVISKDQADGTTAGVSGTPAFFVNGTLLVGAQPFNAFKAIIDKELVQSSKSNLFIKQVYAQDAPGEVLGGEIARIEIDKGHLPPQGNKGAKVTIVEFADLECPYCRRFFLDTYPQIKKEYIDTGKATMYFRHYPLSFHPLAIPFAKAVECANEQNKFWEMHDKIYNEQGT